MKTPLSSSAILRGDFFACAGLFGACLLLMQVGARAQSATSTNAPALLSQSEASPEQEDAAFHNWLELGVGDLWVKDSRAAFRQRYYVREGTFGGIEDFHFEQQLGKATSLSLDGRGVFGSHDYSVSLDVVHQGLGFLRAGYKEFRTWSAGVGGFFPPNHNWLSLSDPSLSLDRGEAWFAAGLTLPDWPVLSAKYVFDFRRGLKDSTEWTFSSLTGGLGTRGIAPSFYDLDENRHTVTGDLRHTLGQTDLNVGLRYQLYDQDDARKARQYPGEGRPNDLSRTTREQVTSDLFNAHFSSVTRLNDSTLFTVGYAFTTLDTDLGGSRIYGFDYDAGFNPALLSPQGYYRLTGGSALQQHVAHLNLMFRLSRHLHLVPSVRVEHQGLESMSLFTSTTSTGLLRDSAEAERGFTDVAERLELRYTGLTNWVLYARGDWSQGDGSLRETGGGGGVPPVLRLTDDSRLNQRYTAGANWYPLRRLNFDFQYFHKIRDTDYTHVEDNTPNGAGSVNRYPAYLAAQDFDMDDVNVRATWRPLSWLTFVSRYDVQYYESESAAGAVSAAASRAAETVSHIVGQTVTMVPWSRLYLQAGLNYVHSRTDSPAQNDSPAGAPARNSYWNGNFTAGLVLDNRSDLQASYFIYRSDNYLDNSAYSVPYGTEAEEHGVTAAYIRRLSKHLRWTLKYGYFTSRDRASGGFNNYEAHMVYTGMQYRF